ncbi:hypothetical protein A0H81_13319 [Grifola frondosa]|uniref:Yeast cell wall synthesis Kre9/Knh1-like N-terminal domain-containing protein n=1 Tax=Grifola frondosa TaxID=5627 RepID=A0A1C7LQA0_GRIFR|nr:hypothetical protein A0H81_13319 [Grifola frondosa]
MFASAALFTVAALAPSALANLYTTAPVATTSWAANTPQTISWQDDGTSPNLTSLGPCAVSVYVGNQIQQTLVQNIVPSVDVSTTSSIVFSPDPNMGENGAYYFIRFQSLSLKDASNSAYPAEAFSAKFALTGMTGTFNSTVSAQIAAASGSTSASTSGSSSGASTTNAATTSNTASKTSSSSSKAASATTSAKAANGAISIAAGAFTGIAGAAVAFLAATLL